MPARNWAIRPKADVSQPAPLGTEDIPAQGFAASHLHQMRARLPRIVDESVDIRSRNLGYGDLLAGGGAAVALLVMLALGLAPWLAIPLAVVTYFAVTLLRPFPEQADEMDGGTIPERPAVEATVEDPETTPLPDPACTGIEAVAVEYGLTRREQQILPLLAHRLTDREIAEQLNISHRTAMNHTANILGKLGLASRRDVADIVARHALPPPTEPLRAHE